MAKKLPLITDFNNIPKEALVPEDEQPYEIPAHWKWVRLGSIAISSKEKTEDFSTPLHYIGLENLSSGGGIASVSDSSGLKSTKNAFQPGDLLYGKLRPYLDKHAIVNFEGVCSTDILVYRPTAAVVVQFVELWISTPYFVNRATAESKGISLPRVSDTILATFPFPLPPLKEQQRIVEYIEQTNAKIDDVIQRLEQYIEEAPTRRNEIIQAGVSGVMTAGWRTEQGLGKDSWLQTSIGELGTVVTGNTPPTKNPENYGDHMPFIKPTDLNQGRHTISAESHLSKIGAKVARVTPAGSVAMCCIGTITKAGLIEVEAATNQQINVLTPSAANDPVFLFYLFESPIFKSEVIASSSSTTLPIINKGRFSKLEVEVPSLREQQIIASMLDDTLSQQEQANGLIQEAIEMLHSLRSNFASAALAGAFGDETF